MAAKQGNPPLPGLARREALSLNTGAVISRTPSMPR
jgi:hypothetical protein